MIENEQEVIKEIRMERRKKCFVCHKKLSKIKYYVLLTFDQNKKRPICEICNGTLEMISGVVHKTDDGKTKKVLWVSKRQPTKYKKK